jgi:hypothetical protein
MKTFAFIPTESIRKTYTGLIMQYKRKDSLIDMIKIGFLVFALLFSFFIYLHYVSLSSTSGYFLRKENQKLNTISFQFEILKTKLLEERQRNREEASSFKGKREVVSVNADLVQIPQVVELSMK